MTSSPHGLDHLATLEAESIHIIREVAAEFERPCLLFSGGKDSVVMLHLAIKAFWPARLPFPLMHVDTGHNFDEVLDFRDRSIEKLDLEMQVITMRGWERETRYEHTGLPWVLPSPNMPTPDTALVYPGMCLVEGTELSEGRGTTRPFELVGAPHIDGYDLAARLEAMKLPGVRFRPCVFTPTFQKHAKQACGGVQLHIEHPETFRPYLTGVAFLKACHDQAPDKFKWRAKAYEFVDKIPAIDLLAGGDALRKGIEAGASLDDLSARWPRDEGAFADEREQFLLYT